MYLGKELEWLYLCFQANPDLVLGPPGELHQEPVSLLVMGPQASWYGSASYTQGVFHFFMG